MDPVGWKLLFDTTKTFEDLVHRLSQDKQLSYDKLADAVDQMADLWNDVLELPKYPTGPGPDPRYLEIYISNIYIFNICRDFSLLWKTVLRSERTYDLSESELEEFHSIVEGVVRFPGRILRSLVVDELVGHDMFLSDLRQAIAELRAFATRLRLKK